MSCVVRTSTTTTFGLSILARTLTINFIINTITTITMMINGAAMINMAIIGTNIRMVVIMLAKDIMTSCAMITLRSALIAVR